MFLKFVYSPLPTGQCPVFSLFSFRLMPVFSLPSCALHSTEMTFKKFKIDFLFSTLRAVLELFLCLFRLLDLNIEKQFRCAVVQFSGLFGNSCVRHKAHTHTWRETNTVQMIDYRGILFYFLLLSDTGNEYSHCHRCTLKLRLILDHCTG